MKSYFFKIGFFFTVIFLISCDGETGLNGIIIDKETGELQENVKVEMISDYETINLVTDGSGYFETKHSYSCGIKKCNESFSIKFEKNGYEKLELNENYASETESVQIIGNETIINLTRSESN